MAQTMFEHELSNNKHYHVVVCQCKIDLYQRKAIPKTCLDIVVP